ncbi:MAG: flagellar basal body rod protein FlgC [Armatimonadota bacterium]|jgi:flagellar basal-body rod protein FlgC|nr:MAG: flagellar basal-body rod protein FlgC [Armatimonadota bacterium]
MPRLSAFDISAMGLSAQRQRLDVVAENIANVNTTRTPDGGPYRRKQVVFETVLAGQGLPGAEPQGVLVSEVTTDPAPPKTVYEPGHPDADERGFVTLPNVNIVDEMVDLISATRSYEANVTALNATKGMLMKALEIGRR